MAHGLYDWIKLGSDVIKNNWPQLILLCGMLGSFGTNASQYFTNVDHEAEQKAKDEQIAAIANHYAATTPKTVKSSCGNCSILLNSHIKELH